MRIASSTLYNNAIANMNQQEATLVNLQQQISSGKRVVNPGDDPIAAATAVKINQQISRSGDLASNRQTVEASLNTVSTTLSSATSLLNSIKSELVAAGNGTYDVPQRKFLASQLQSQMQDMLGYANAQDGNGEYLFSGFQSQTQPFSYGNFVTANSTATNAGDASLSPGNNALAAKFPGQGTVTITAYTPPAAPGGTPSFTYSVTGLGSSNVSNVPAVNGQITVGGATLTLSGTPVVGDSFSLNPAPTQYQGDSGVRNVEVFEGRQMASNLTGDSLFNQVPTGNGTFATAASTGNSGTGTISAGTVVSAAALTKDSYQLQFQGTGTLAPATTNTGSASVDPNATSGAPLTLDNYHLSFNTSGGTTTYDVLDTTTGASVLSAQPFTAGSPMTVNGVTFTINGQPGQGDSFTLSPGPSTQFNVIDTSTGSTLLSNQTFVSGNAIQFAGMSFAVSGKPNAGDTFQVAPSQNTSLFSLMQAAIDALSAGGSGPQANTNLANALSAANAGIDAAQAQISLGQTTVGGRLQELSTLDTSGSQLQIQYKQTLSQLTDIDVTAALSNFSQAQVALTAAQKSFVSVQSLSLFNFIQ